jgi:urea transporter
MSMLIQAALNGYSQIFFQESLLLGLFCIIGLGVVSPVSLIYSIVGNVLSITIASILGVDTKMISSGTWGFNGILLGVFLSFFLKGLPYPFLWFVMSIAAAVVIQMVLIKMNFPVFAAPFVLVAFSLVFIKRIFFS